MILGGMDEFVELTKRSKERRYYTIVCDGYEDSPAKAFADEAFTIDVRNTDEIAELCRKENVDGIIASFSDLLAECMIDIAEKAGIPCYAAPERFRPLRDKSLMKAMFEELEVPTPRTVKVHKSTIEQDIAPIGLPCVVKPANGYGSRGVYIFDSLDEIRNHFDEVASYSSFDFIIAEKLIRGCEFNMTNWMVDGELYTVSIADREKTSMDPTLVPYVTRIVYPSRLRDVVYEPARRIVKSVADYIGIKTGPISMQFFYDEEDGIQVCEIAGRLFGYEHELVTYSSGLSIEDLLLDQVYDHASLKRSLQEHDPFFSGLSAGLYFHGLEGLIGDVSDAERALDIPEVVESKFYYQQGEEIRHGVGAKPYAVRCYLQAGSRERLDEITAKLYEDISIKSLNGEELLLKNCLD